MSQQPKRILICYSPKDADGAAELAAHLAPGRGSVSIWTLDKVLPGDLVREAVEQAAAGADAVLLLLSSDFFAALDDLRFAEQIEELRRQHKVHGLRIVPILWRPCDWRAVDWLAKLKLLPVDGAALTSMDMAQRDMAFAEIARQLSGRGRLSMRGLLSGMRREAGLEMPSRDTLLTKSRNQLTANEADFERAVDVKLGIVQVPQLVKAQHMPHGGTRDPVESRSLEEGLLDYTLRVERLLLVGMPGVGKTQTLRSLCWQLLTAAQEEPDLPVPFVISLSTFSQYPGSLRDWFAEGLKESAAIPLAVGKALLAQGLLFLLLDGLDEMAAERRGATLIEINALVNDAAPELARCVVCSRTMEYTEAGVPLKLSAALELQPLRPDQVREAVEQAGPSAASLRAAMAKDQTLETVLQTPLLLAVAVRAFAGTPGIIPLGHSSNTMRQLLYDAYVVQMIRRTATNLSQTAYLTLHYLRWLAQYLTIERSSLFLIERLQPTIVATERTYRGTFRLVRGLVAGLVSWLIFWRMSESLEGGAVFGLGVALGVGVGLELGIGLGYGLAGGMIYGQLRIPDNDFMIGPTVAWICGLACGLLTGLVGRARAAKIVPVERLRWSLAQAMKIRKFHLFIWPLVGVGTFFMGGGVQVGVTLGLGGALIRLVGGGWMKTISVKSVQPNEGIRSSVRNGIQEGLGVGLAGALGGIWGRLFADFAVFSWPGTLISVVLAVGLAIGLGGGLGEALKHYILRAFLWREGKLPLRLVPWLESCRARLLLRRQGGAYLFWHATLQDYFAELDDKRLAELAKRIEARPVYEQSY